MQCVSSIGGNHWLLIAIVDWLTIENWGAFSDVLLGWVVSGLKKHSLSVVLSLVILANTLMSRLVSFVKDRSVYPT